MEELRPEELEELVQELQMRCPYCSKEIEDQAIICGHCGRAVMEPAGPSLPEPGVFDQEQVLFEAKDEKRHYTWQLACVELDPVARTLAVHGSPYGTPEITIPVSEIAHCEIIESEDIPRDMSRTSGGDISGVNDWGDLVLGLLLSVLLAVFEATIENFRAKRTKVPVLRLTQSKGDNSDQGWVIDLRSDRRGNKGRAATLEMAHRIGAFLCLTGYGGIIPKELNLPKAPEALVKVVQARQEQLASAGSPACATIGRFVVWSSLAGLVAGLVIGMINAKNHWYLPVESLDLVPGTLLALAVGGTVGAALGAALRWREHPRRIVGMIAGAIVAAIVASLTHFIAFFVWIGY